MDAAPPPVFLSSDEVDRLCFPYKRAASRIEFLDRARFKYVLDASGQPLVLRGQFTGEPRVAGLAVTPREPNAAALKALFSKRRK